jgi:protein-tyrosine phosphatase
MPGIVDLHSHLIPGVDDGARNLEQALAGLGALNRAGVTTLAVTPHLNATLTTQRDVLELRLAELDTGWQALTGAAGEGVELRRGVEIMLDTPQVELSDERVRIGGGPYVLVEFAYLTVPPRSTEVLAVVRAQGVRPVLAHPERYPHVAANPALVGGWRAGGAQLQLNGGSLLGRYGGSARRAALALLEAGAIDYVASDYHSRGDPGVVGYTQLLEELLGPDAADRLLAENPRRVLAGEPLLAPPPLPRRPLWRRLRELLS